MDIIYDVELGITEEGQMRAFCDPHKLTKIKAYDAFTDLLVPVFRHGKLVYPDKSIHALRLRALGQGAQFFAAYGLSDYPVGLENNLYELKQQLIADITHG
jgi:hypothetical protein